LVSRFAVILRPLFIALRANIARSGQAKVFLKTAESTLNAIALLVAAWLE